MNAFFKKVADTHILTPNKPVTKNVGLMLLFGWIAFVLVFWMLAPNSIKLIPTPLEVLKAMGVQWSNGILYQLFTSLQVSLEAIFFAAIIGLGLSYLSTVALFKTPVEWISKLRFLSLTGIILIFVLITPNGHILKVSVLTFAIVTFLVNDMLQVIDDIPSGKFDHARTLGLNNFQILKEVVVRGTLANAFEVLRMNAAMSWMMLTMVEGLSRSEGGIGVLLINLNRHMRLDAILGIQLMIFVVGIGQDFFIKFIKSIICPYANK